MIFYCNHLGNVLATVSDRKIAASTSSTGSLEYFEVAYTSFTDYYPFGMMIKERAWSSSSYRFGFNGQEKDDEVSGAGNSYTAQFWQYDSRIARRWNRDVAEKKYPSISPYLAFMNSPILLNDPNGDDPDPNKSRKNLKKYSRKFDRFLKRTGVDRTDKGAFKDAYNEFNLKNGTKKWMWTHEASAKSDKTSGGGHQRYYHTGESYLKSIGITEFTSTKTVRIPIVEFDSDVYADGLGGFNVYRNFKLSYSERTPADIEIRLSPSRGRVSYMVNQALGRGTQGDNLVSWTSSPSSPTSNRTITIDPSLGRVVKIGFNTSKSTTPADGNWTTVGSSISGITATATITRNYKVGTSIQITRSDQISSPVAITEQVARPEKLNRSTRRALSNKYNAEWDSGSRY